MEVYSNSLPDIIRAAVRARILEIADSYVPVSDEWNADDEPLVI